MDDKRIEELLAKVARELVKDVHLPAHSLYLAVLRRELLPLLKAGEFAVDQCEAFSRGKTSEVPASEAKVRWDAALGGSEESDGRKA